MIEDFMEIKNAPVFLKINYSCEDTFVLETVVALLASKSSEKAVLLSPLAIVGIDAASSPPVTK